MTPSHRDTLFLEEAVITLHDAFEGDQYVLHLKAPECARRARPGSFVHLQCDPLLPMRRPISIMRAQREQGIIELLYKVVGHGTSLLTQRKAGERLSLIGPIGHPFTLHAERPRPLLIGGGVGMPPMIFLADHLRGQKGVQPLVLLGSEAPFPFQARPSQILLPTLPAEAIACMPLLDDWDIPSRLVSQQGYPGCYEGYVTDLARLWLDALDGDTLAGVEIFACGPHPMLEAVARLAADFNLPCQVSLEEFMACGVGGCAGCAVEVLTDAGPAMKRVCVDGPVFDANRVFF